MKKMFAAFALVFGISSLAQAGILIEPYLGYQMGQPKYTYASSVPSFGGQSGSDNVSGAALGLRLGYKLLLPWIALDYTGTTGTAKPDSKFSSKDYDYTQTSLAAVVGVDLPVIHVWAGYGFSNQATYVGSGGNNDMKFKGNYVKAGVGFGFIPFINLNVEYIMNNFNRVDVGNGEQDRGDIFSELKSDSILLSVSLPFNL